jgi:hypothetical protein
VTLRVTHVALDRVEFLLVDEAGHVVRHVAVLVGSGASWRAAVVFPSTASDATASTGDDALDEEVRWRAAEELVRLEAREGRVA